jgi:YD repeat-containing protein
VGNLIESFDTSGSWTYNANNELEGYSDVTFAYDANGNMIEKSDNGVVTRFFYTTVYKISN